MLMPSAFPMFGPHQEFRHLKYLAEELAPRSQFVKIEGHSKDIFILTFIEIRMF